MSTGDEDDGSWVFDSLVNFLHGNIWRIPVLGFIEEKSVVFDPDSYNNMTDEKEEEFRKIHEEYKALVDYMLSSYMEDLHVTPEQVEEGCRLREQNKTLPESNITKIALEQLWSAEDFNTFRRLLTRKNIDLQLQSLELLVAKYGVLSPSLCPASSEDHDPNGEEDFLQVVIRYTEHSIFHSSLVTPTFKCCLPPLHFPSTSSSTSSSIPPTPRLISPSPILPTSEEDEDELEEDNYLISKKEKENSNMKADLHNKGNGPFEITLVTIENQNLQENQSVITNDNNDGENTQDEDGEYNQVLVVDIKHDWPKIPNYKSSELEAVKLENTFKNEEAILEQPKFQEALLCDSSSVVSKQSSCLNVAPVITFIPSQILQQEENENQTGHAITTTTPIDGPIKPFPPSSRIKQLSLEPSSDAPNEAVTVEVDDSKISTKEPELDAQTVAELASVAPEQHRILTAVRRALQDTGPEDYGSSTMQLPTGSEEEIASRREYLTAQRDKLVALKKREREKQLANFSRGSSTNSRPKSARAAQNAIKNPQSISTGGTSEKSLSARRALAQALKAELVDK